MKIRCHDKVCVCNLGAECKGIASAFYLLEDARGGHTKIPPHVYNAKTPQDICSNQWRELLIEYVNSEDFGPKTRFDENHDASSVYIANHHFHPQVVEAAAVKTSPGATFKMPMTIPMNEAERLGLKDIHVMCDKDGQPTDRVFVLPNYNFANVKQDIKRTSHLNVVAKNYQLVELQDSEEKSAKAGSRVRAAVPGAVMVSGTAAAAAAASATTDRGTENGMRYQEKDVLRHGQFSSFHKTESTQSISSFSKSKDDGDKKKIDMEQFESSSPEGDEGLVHAAMVTDGARSRVKNKDVEKGELGEKKELATAHAKEVKPWYKRRKVVAGLILSACVIIGVAVGVSVGLSNKDSSNQEPSATISMSDITLVMLVDYQPEQVGWKLECDNQVIHDIPTGTYGLLGYGVSGVGSRRRLHRHGGRLIDTFRVEYTTQVPYNSTCVFNITDSGGDGLIGGFYEIYYGNDVADPKSLMKQVSFEGYYDISQFQAISPKAEDGSSSPPQKSLTSPFAKHVDDKEHCSICPGGEPVPDKSEELDGNRTCGQVEDLLADLFSNCPLNHDLIHECGCNNQCDKLCRDGSTVPRDSEDNLVKVENGYRVTCKMAQDKVERTISRQSDCLRSSYIGETFCGCPKEREFCHVCPDNESPTDLTRELVPGVTCEGLSGIGYSLPRSDERYAPICPACQGLGAYCGCPQEQSTESYCRLCGDSLLPELGRIVFFPLLNITTTCIHVEFQANVNSTEVPGCAAFQEDFGAHCCA